MKNKLKIIFKNINIFKMILIKIVRKENKQKVSQKLLDWLSNFDKEYKNIYEIKEFCQNEMKKFENNRNVILAKEEIFKNIKNILEETNNVYRISDVLDNSSTYLKSRVTNQIEYNNYSILLEYLNSYDDENYQIFYKKVSLTYGHEDY